MTDLRTLLHEQGNLGEWPRPPFDALERRAKARRSRRRRGTAAASAVLAVSALVVPISLHHRGSPTPADVLSAAAAAAHCSLDAGTSTVDAGSAPYDPQRAKRFPGGMTREQAVAGATSAAEDPTTAPAEVHESTFRAAADRDFAQERVTGIADDRCVYVVDVNAAAPHLVGDAGGPALSSYMIMYDVRTGTYLSGTGVAAK